MTESKFIEIFIKICNYYKCKNLLENKEIIKEYYELLKDRDPKTLIKEITNQFSWMPKITELKQTKSKLIEKYKYTQREYESIFFEGFYDVGGKDK